MELETRDFEIREVDSEERTVTGLAVPYGQTAQVGNLQERFEPNAFEDNSGAPLFYGHDHRQGGMPIGRVIEAQNTAEGLVIKAKLSKTAKANDVHELLRDGTISKFSVGFEPVKQKMVDGVIVRQKANLKEVSVTPLPAYAGAAVSEVREEPNTNKGDSQENTMTETAVETRSDDVAELRETVTGLERRVADLGNSQVAESGDALSQYRSLGEFVKAYADGKVESAQIETYNRTYTGATTTSAAGQPPTWIQRSINQVADKRVFLNQFGKQALPSEGMSVTYPVFGAASGSGVGQQVNQGDALGYVGITTTSASANVSTYGGYTTLSKQVLDRVDSSYVDAVLQRMAIQYAAATNSAVRTAITGASGIQTGSVSAHTGAAWISAVVTAVGNVFANSVNLSVDGILVSLATFETLSALVDSTGRPLFVVSGSGTNSLGNANITGLSANVGGVPVIVDPTLTGTFAYAFSSGAATVLESPGAPFQLSDQNIITLTNDFSLYGYLAATVNDPKGIVKIDASAG